jgi:hypothetical protein
VINAKYIDNFKIKVVLQSVKNKNKTKNQVSKIIDLKQYIQSKKDNGIFSLLKNVNYFKNFKLSTNTIEWENGADIAPERFLEL